MKKYIALEIIALMIIAGSLSAETYYASPEGGGVGASVASPFRVIDFWSVAKPGDVLILLDGKYTGSHSMINPPQGLSGAPGQAIHIKALNEGKVEIDGEGVRRPVYLVYNDYYILEGFDAHSSNDAVVELHRSNYNVVRKVCAWDAGDVNTGNCFAAHHGTHNLFEDCAGWGVSRKVFDNSQGGDHTTFRRCWGEWEKSTVTGPKMTYTFCYNSYNTVLENCIGSWNSSVASADQPYGIFSMDRNDGDKNANSKLLGCIAYLTGDQTFHATQLYFVTKLNAVEIRDCLAYIEPGSHTAIRPFALYANNDGAPSTLRAENLTCIGAAESIIDASWNPQNVHHSVDGSELFSSGKNLLKVDGGANVMNRYVDGQLTNDPLWPWPMNQRIIDAMQRSGREPVDVTQTVSKFAGQIPPSNEPLQVTDIRFTKAGDTQPLENVKKGTWYDVYVSFNASSQDWSRIAYADLWLSTPFYSDGNASNRGGDFYASDSYVLSLSISNPSLWVREIEGSLSWRNTSGILGLYVDDDSSEYQTNPAEGWAKVRIRLLEDADVSQWTVRAYVKGTDGLTSGVYEKRLAVESRSLSPKAQVAISPSSPIKDGEIVVNITTSTNVVNTPTLFFTDKARVKREIALSGQVPGNVFTSTITVGQDFAEGVGKFTLPSDALADQTGNKSNDIVSGRYLLIDKTAPTPPSNLNGVFHE
jgi:hypothetical protein